MLTKGNLILPEAFKDVLDPASGRESLPAMTASTFKKSRAQTLAMFEKKYLLDQLTKHRGNVTASAKASGMTRQNFQRLMTKNKIGAKNFRS